MVIRLTSTEVQQEFGEVMERVLTKGEVIVERYGSPRVVILEYRRYQQLLEVERKSLKDRLHQASQTASQRASHLSDAEVDELIERARRE